jgi:hypothetical protein
MFSRIVEKVMKKYPSMGYLEAEMLVTSVLREINHLDNDILMIGLASFETSPTLSPRGRLERAWKGMIKSIMCGH